MGANRERARVLLEGLWHYMNEQYDEDTTPPKLWFQEHEQDLDEVEHALDTAERPGESMISYVLWLDDVRDPHTNDMRDSFIIARNLETAKHAVVSYGMPLHLYLDHDLGESEDAMMFLKWLHGRYPKQPPPTHTFLTSNPVGKENMRAFLFSWSKALS
jgi:hypothetical protein